MSNAAAAPQPLPPLEGSARTWGTIALSAATFIVVLWTIGGALTVTIGGVPITIPGFLVVAAVIYSFVAMGLTHLVGRPLVPINFNRLRVEANFRYGLVRFRDNAEAVAAAELTAVAK